MASLDAQGPFSESLLREVLTGKLSRGRSNAEDRQTLYDMVEEMLSFHEVCVAQAAPETEAVAGAAFGLAAATTILMTVETPDAGLFDLVEVEDGVRELLDLSRGALAVKRSNAAARDALAASYLAYRQIDSSFYRAFAEGLAAAAGTLGGLDSGNPLLIPQSAA